MIKQDWIKTTAVALTVAVCALGASACNTIEGAEEDVESVADEVD